MLIHKRNRFFGANPNTESTAPASIFVYRHDFLFFLELKNLIETGFRASPAKSAFLPVDLRAVRCFRWNGVGGYFPLLEFYYGDDLL